MGTIDIGEGQESISDMEKPLTREQQASLFPRPVHVKDKLRDPARGDEKRDTVMQEEGRRRAAIDPPINSTFSPLDLIGAPGALAARNVPSLVGALARTMRREPEPPAMANTRPQYGPPSYEQYKSDWSGSTQANIQENLRRYEQYADLLKRNPEMAPYVSRNSHAQEIGGLPAIQSYVARQRRIPLPE